MAPFHIANGKLPTIGVSAGKEADCCIGCHTKPGPGALNYNVTQNTYAL